MRTDISHRQPGMPALSQIVSRKPSLPPGGVGDEVRVLMKTYDAFVTGKINIETRRSTTPGKRVILVQGPC